MITCDTPNQRLNYIFSCHLLAQVQIKIGRLEGERIKPAYKDLIQNPVLNYSGAFQHNDLYVTAQIYANNQALCMPVKTSYKYIEKTPWQWDEWLTLPLKISDLPRNALLAITAWDIESPQAGDVPVCGATVTLFDKYGEFRQGGIELRLWPNKSADGCSKTTTPGVFSDLKESELEEAFNGAYGVNHLNNNNNNANTSNAVDEFPILDELDRLAKMSRYHADGHMIKQDWLDRLTFKEIQNAIKREKQSVANSKFFFMNVEFAQIKCDDTKYNVLYYEENAERIMQTVPMNDLFVINDPELELDNIIELKNRKLEHSKQMGVMDMNLRPDPESKNMLAKIVSYPVTRPLKREEQALLWKYRYFLTQNKKALTKFLQCFDLNLEFEGNMLMELMLKWQPMDVEDALELLGSKYENYPKIRSYAVSRLRLASNEDLILYLLQLVQALRYENFNPSQNQNQNIPTIKSIDGSLTVSSESSSKAASLTTSEIKNKRSKKNKLQNSASSGSLRQLEQLGADDQNEGKSNEDTEDRDDSGDENDDDDDDSNDNTDQTAKLNVDFSSSPPLAAALLPNRANLYQNESDSKKTFEYNLKTFLLERALENEIVALCLYWYVKVENKDVNKVINTSPSSNTGLNTITSSSNLTTPGLSSAQDSSKSNFQIFMDELLESLRTGDSYARSIYENILNQEKFLKSLNEIVKATGKEGGNRDKKVQKLRTLLSETSKVTIPSVSSTTVSPGANLDLVNFNMPIPLIIDPNVKAIGINVDKTTMFVSNLMPCKFVFRTFNPDLVTSSIDMPEYSVIYKIGDDLRQDQLVLQMIALMDKLLKQENLDLKLTPYKVIATGVKEGFLQFVDALPLSKIIGANSDFRTVREYLRRHNPSDADRYGISAEAMDNYVRSCAGYLVITYILGIGDRHYDNILITKNGKIVHIDFGYILGRDPKPFQPTIKWTKDMADGMGGRYGPDGKTENKEYEDFKKFCCNAFLHLRRHANVILNLFSLMVDANIPDIAIEPDKTVKKLIDRFKLDVSDEQALLLLMREIESNYDHIVGNITDIIHGINTRQ